MQDVCAKLSKDKAASTFEDKTFYRKVWTVLQFDLLHVKLFNPLANKYFHEDLKPSYSLVALYDQNESICPYHVDRKECYRTIDLCINQDKPWPLYIAHEGIDINVTADQYEGRQEDYKKLGQEYLLNPGDAVFYSGTQFPHWRNKIQKDNFCQMVFFHFVAKDYED